MKNFWHYFISFFLVLFAVTSHSTEISYIKNIGGKKIVEVKSDSVEKDCGKNFAFRETKKEEVADYLKKDIVKAAFQGKMIGTLDGIISEIQAHDNMCAWVTADELKKVPIAK